MAAALVLGLPAQYVPAADVEVWEVAANGSIGIRAGRWPVRVDAVRLLASVPINAFHYGGQWPNSGNLKPRTAAIYRLNDRDLLTITVRQSCAGQLAVLPFRAALTRAGVAQTAHARKEVRGGATGSDNRMVGQEAGHGGLRFERHLQGTQRT